jgi:hypothetical protein
MAPGVHRLWFRDLRYLRGTGSTSVAGGGTTAGPAAGSSEELSQIITRIASLGASEISDWRVSIEFIQHKTAKDRSIYRVKIPFDCPGRVFHVFQLTMLETDENMIPLLDMLKKFSPGNSVSIEGHQVRLGDFRVRLGRLVQNNFPVAMILDIEYLPFTVLSDQKWLAMDELALDINEITKTLTATSGAAGAAGTAAGMLSSQQQFSSFVKQEPSTYKKFHLGDEMTWAHYVLDYIFVTVTNQKK